jgi:sulfhydrogenase subunit beta (sulfur reductase)
MTAPADPGAHGLRLLDVEGLAHLLDQLRLDEGYTLIGPTVRAGAIVPAEISGLADLPRGVGDEQIAGRYRLRARGDSAFFGWAAPAQSPRRELLPPRLPLVQLRRTGPEIHDARPPTPRLAFIGVRPCDVAALGVTDRVLARGPHAEADRVARREASFVLAASCGEPSGTCFCVSMGTGPRARAGFDLALTELLDPHRFVVEVGSDRGARVLARLGAPPAAETDLAAARAVVTGAAARMGRHLETAGLPAALAAQLEHPRWDEVADRCLGCASCTLVCPTCFCTTIEEASDLDGEVATRTRVWDSCFTPDFAYVHGGSARPSLRARYRQWLLHKLSFWVEQTGESGCVGCGRCVTWCPVGIDLVVEAEAVARGA